jgi:hypothetical protein
MNLYDAVLGEDARSIKLGSQQVDLPDTVAIKRPALRSYIGKDVVVGMRPEHLRAAPPDYTGPTLIGNVELVEALGSELVVHFTIDANRVLAEGAVDKDEAAAVKDGEGVARVAAKTPVKPGDKLSFAIDIEDMQFFDTQTDLAIRDLPRRTTISQENDDGNNFRDLTCRPGPGTGLGETGWPPIAGFARQIRIEKAPRSCSARPILWVG